jgi:maltose alpha-D-glucosyltransferase/alpha-amylase
MRIRCHGNYGLDDVLCQADDFVIVDFEGNPDQSIAQRRTKASPLRDVAGMIWSFDRAALHGLREYCAVTEVDRAELTRLTRWHDFWRAWTGAEFVRSYMAVMSDSLIIPQSKQAIQALLSLYFAERCATALDRDLESQVAESLLSLRQMERFLEAADLTTE